MQKTAERQNLIPSEKKIVEIIDFEGTVLWFNLDKGYGFIAPDDGGEQALLTITCLLASNCFVIHDGARVRAHVVRHQGKLKAFRLLSIIDPGLEDPPISLSGETISAKTASEGEWARTKVQWFDPIKGYGFVDNPQGGRGIFVHITTLQKCGVCDLAENQDVDVQYEGTSDKLRVSAIRLPQDA